MSLKATVTIRDEYGNVRGVIRTNLDEPGWKRGQSAEVVRLVSDPSTGEVQELTLTWKPVGYVADGPAGEAFSD